MIKYLQPITINDKMKLMQFVYDNTDSFILNTFGFLWESRQWWQTQPIQILTVNDKIVGLHAFSINTKAPGTLKTYYIITSKDHRKQGIAKRLIVKALEDYKDKCDNYFVNTEQDSDGKHLFLKLFDNQYVLHKNEFNTFDMNFEQSIESILNNAK